MQDALNEAIDSKTRDSKRLNEAGVVKRPIDQNYSSQHNQPNSSGQVPYECERYRRHCVESPGFFSEEVERLKTVLKY